MKNLLSSLVAAVGNNLPTVLGAAGTFLGAIATAWAALNAAHISSLQFQVQTDTAFATTMESEDSKLITADEDHAMVAFVSLYAQAETVLHKLEIIELAQTAERSPSMIALSGIVNGDTAVQHPAKDDLLPATAIKAAINQFGNTVIAAHQTPPPTSVSSGSNNQGGVLVPTSDPPVTQSKNPEVQSNAALIAALPVGTVTGWAFIGNASGANRDAPDATLDPLSDVISSSRVPAAGTLITACQDINIRIKPFQNGALGQLVGIAPSGSMLKVDSDTPLSADALSTLPPHQQIAAKWVHVTLLQKTPTASSGPSPSPC